jgi:hypothetical protein
MREWTADEIARMVFDESPTDMIIAQPLPLTDLFKDGLSSWEKCAAMARKYPDRDDLLGIDQPARRKEGARSDGDSGQGVRRPGVQTLQCAL